MKTKNIPTDIKSKSIKEAKLEILQILEKLENDNVDLDASKEDYRRLLKLNDHINGLFREKIKNIRNPKIKNITTK
tara:strand:- start:64 stop:291 length:228 start_codon:yes stop_codon:yes gene_type:complete